MKKVLLLTGDLATGKSTYAKILSDKLQIMLLTKDRLKEILGDEIGFKNREENLKLSNASMSLMFYVLDEAIKVNLPLILEANFKDKDIKRIYNFKEINDLDILILRFQADYDILYERFMHRIKYEKRHIVHQSAGLTDFNKFKEYLAKGRDIDLTSFNVIDVDASNFNYQNDFDLLMKIKRFFEV